MPEKEIIRPVFLDDIKLPPSYEKAPDPYCDAPSNGVSLLKLSRYASSRNKKITDLSIEEVLKFKK